MTALWSALRMACYGWKQRFVGSADSRLWLATYPSSSFWGSDSEQVINLDDAKVFRVQ